LSATEEWVEIAKAIKSIFSKNIAFVIDPNQCFEDSKHAISVLGDMQSVLGNIIAIEQPVEKHDYEGLLEIKNNLINTAIYADESIVTLQDLDKLIEMKAVDGVNIKIQKAGGIANARRMAQRAHAAGLKIMVGCMMEEPLGVAAGIHFAVTTPNVAFTDLDSDLFLSQQFKEPVFTMSPFQNGIRMPTEKPGLGIDFHEQVIKNMAKNNEIFYEEV
jgi:L-alanine-DL-glutamate epimerase-like enolase superfamily enzyme